MKNDKEILKAIEKFNIILKEYNIKASDNSLNDSLRIDYALKAYKTTIKIHALKWVLEG